MEGRVGEAVGSVGAIQRDNVVTQWTRPCKENWFSSRHEKDKKIRCHGVQTKGKDVMCACVGQALALST